MSPPDMNFFPPFDASFPFAPSQTESGDSPVYLGGVLLASGLGEDKTSTQSLFHNGLRSAPSRYPDQYSPSHGSPVQLSSLPSPHPFPSAWDSSLLSGFVPYGRGDIMPYMGYGGQLSTPPAPYSTLPYINEQESFTISPILLSGYCSSLPPTPRLASQPLSPVSPMSETSSLPSDSYESFSAPSSPPTSPPSSLCGAMGNLDLDAEGEPDDDVAPASPGPRPFSENESEDDAEYAPSTSKARRAAKKAVASQPRQSPASTSTARAAPKRSARAPTEKPARAAARERAAPYTRKHTATTTTTPTGRVVPTYTASRNEQIGLPSEYVKLNAAESKTHICPACGDEHQRAADLVRHFKTHYGLRDDVCACGTEFSRTDALRRHVRKHKWALCAIL